MFILRFNSMSIKTYQAVFDPDKENVYSISLVDDPAMQSMFLALKKQEKRIKLAEVDKVERTLLGVVLIPDKPIYRNQGGEEFYITFPKETIQASAHNFITRGFQLNSSLEHEDKIEGISFVESWVVKDPKNDTANAYGLDKDDIVEGSWVVKMKCDNDDIYQKALNGEINGFSIDGMFGLKEINLNINKVEMVEEKKSFMEQLKVMFAEVGLVKKVDTEVKLGSVQSGDILLEYEGDVLEVGTPVFVTVEEERVAVPDAEYPSDMGVIVVVDSVVTEVRTEVEAGAETPASVPSTDEAVQAIKSLLIKYKEDQPDYEVRFKALEDINKELKAEIVELKKEPAGKAIKTVATQKSYKDMSNLERLKFNREN